ncbi:MAG: GTP-binding protein [Bacilli bacterium]
MNELLGHSRAIVSPKAGTTRDFIDEKIIIDGCSANLTDTAGLRNSDDAIESAGISKALEKISACDVCLLTIDVSDPKLSLPQETQDLLSAKNTVVVLNKCDAEGADPDKYKKIYKEFACVETSCRTHQGISSLRAAISQLIKSNSILPAADDILVSSRHAQALSKAKSCLMSAAEKTIKDIPSELVASDVREALNALGEITGKTDNEQILDRVFSKFCIGK